MSQRKYLEHSLPEDIVNYCATVATFKRKLSNIDLTRFVIFNCFYFFSQGVEETSETSFSISILSLYILCFILYLVC